MSPSIFEGRETPERIMRSLYVVLVHPFFRDGPHFRQGIKDIHIEHLIAIGAVESFDIGILSRLARLDKFQVDRVVLGLVSQDRRDKLWPIVHAQFARIPAPGDDPVQHTLDPLRRQADVDLYGQGFTTKVINDIECPKPTAAKQAVAHKIQRPATIDRLGYLQRHRSAIR